MKQINRIFILARNTVLEYIVIQVISKSGNTIFTEYDLKTHDNGGVGAKYL